MAIQPTINLLTDDAAPGVRDRLHQEWLAAGMSSAQLSQEEEVAGIFERLAGAGYPMDALQTLWEADDTNADAPDDLACAYRRLYQRLYEAAKQVLPAEDTLFARLERRLT